MRTGEMQALNLESSEGCYRCMVCSASAPLVIRRSSAEHLHGCLSSL